MPQEIDPDELERKLAELREEKTERDELQEKIDSQREVIEAASNELDRLEKEKAELKVQLGLKDKRLEELKKEDGQIDISELVQILETFADAPYDSREKIAPNLANLADKSSGELRVKLYELAIKYSEVSSADREFLGITRSKLADFKEGRERSELLKQAVLNLREIMAEANNGLVYFYFGRNQSMLADEEQDKERRIKMYEVAKQNLEIAEPKKEDCIEELIQLYVKTLLKLGDELEGEEKIKNYKLAIFHSGYKDLCVAALRGIAEAKLGNEIDGEIEVYLNVGEKITANKKWLFEDAVSNLTKAIGADSNNADYYHWRGKSLLKLGEELEGEERRKHYRIAVDDLKETVKRRGNEEDYWELGNALIALDSSHIAEEVMQELEEVVKRRGRTDDYHCFGKLLSRLSDIKIGDKEKQYEKAAPFLLEAVKKRGNIFDYHELSHVLYQLREFKIHWLEKIVEELEPIANERDDAENYYRLADFLRRLGEVRKNKEEKAKLYEKALSYIERAKKKRGEEDVDDYTEEGIILEKFGDNVEDKTEARDYYIRSVGAYGRVIELRGWLSDYVSLGPVLSKAYKVMSESVFEVTMHALEKRVSERGTSEDYNGFAHILAELGDNTKGKTRERFYEKAVKCLKKGQSKGVDIGFHLQLEIESKLDEARRT
jgi:hypothetical protein